MNGSLEDTKFILKKYNIHPYNEKNGSGIVRHIIIRIGKNTNEVMVTIVLNKEKLINEQKIIKENIIHC